MLRERGRGYQGGVPEVERVGGSDGLPYTPMATPGVEVVQCNLSMGEARRQRANGAALFLPIHDGRQLPRGRLDAGTLGDALPTLLDLGVYLIPGRRLMGVVPMRTLRLDHGRSPTQQGLVPGRGAGVAPVWVPRSSAAILEWPGEAQYSGVPSW